MKLWLGNTALHDLARHVQVLSQASVLEPVEAPQRQRRTVRVRLEFREDLYLANAQLVEQVRTALRTPTTTLLWQDDAGPKYLQRWVIVAEDDQPEADNAWGTYQQSLTFTFYYYVHTLTTNCLPATLQRLPSGATLDLGAILKWGETLDVDRFDEMKDPRRKVLCNLVISGRFQGNTAASLDDCRNGLFAAKATLVAELVAGVAFRLTYGVAGALKFDETVRIKRFTADVDQPNHCLEWSLQAVFTKTPAEADYAWLEYDLTSRETKSEGIISLGLRGRIAASSEVKARAALQELYTGPASLIPNGYVQVSVDTTPHTVKSADGTAFTELIFDLDWRDTTTLECTLKKSGGETARDLGIVEKFADRQSNELFDPLRPHRKRAGGLVNASGRILLPDSMSVAAKQAELKARKELLDADLVAQASVELTYGGADGIFPPRTVRVVDWDCQINRLRNQLEWTLSCTYTRFPNESDYALCEFRLGTRENKVEGTVNRTLSGRIGAPTAEAAHERLARLRAAVIPQGFAQIGDEPVEQSVSVESNRNSGGDTGDGTTFIELTFNDEWQKFTGDLLNWSLRITHADDVKSGYVRTTYSGSVTARGASLDAAGDTAEAQAETLGANKYPFQTSATVTRNEKLFQNAAGVFFVTVEFSYEYQRKGLKVYLEVTAERNVDTFGQTTEAVSGFVAAPTYALAQAAYLADVRNLAEYANQLLLNERTPTKTQQTIRGVAGADQFDRYQFGFTVFLAKTAAETAVEYDVRTTDDLQNLTQTSVVSGRVFAMNRSVADALLATLLPGLALGTRAGTPERGELTQQGPKVTGSGAVAVFLGLSFSETYVRRLTGLDGVLECEVTEQLRYSGKRLVEKPIPGSISLFQHTGTTPGQRVVSGRVRGTTEAACLAWARKCRTLMITATYEEAPLVTTTFRFLPQTDGTPRGAGADVLVYEAAFQFQEWLPEHVFVP